MLRICPTCARYTLKDACPECGADTRDPHPPKFSPEEKHGVYRRKLKRLNEQDAAEGAA